MKSRIEQVLKDTIADCFEKGLLKETPLPGYVIEVPNNPDHGHFATNLPMTLASSQRRSPRDIAAVILQNLKDEAGLIDRLEVAGPGFLNFWVRSTEWHGFLARILEEREDFGRCSLGQGLRVLVEFVSANPTGPLHLGHGRGAALGDTLCRILECCGYDVEREFYINDAGQQIQMLGKSIYSRVKQRSDPAYPFPEKGYHGDYIRDLAETVGSRVSIDGMSEEEACTYCAQAGKEIMLEEIRRDLDAFRVRFDVWYPESELFQSGLLDATLQTLKNSGRLYEQDGALWIRTTEFGDDKDRVLRKGDGQFTYFASDIAYHLQKRARGFDKAINLWGADHHGYVPRIQAALQAHGLPSGWLSVMLIQLVKLWKGGQEMKMSKRAGSYVTLEELLAEVGVDAARFVFLTKSHDSSLDFDVDLVKKQDSDNPVYYVQYAHARICSIFRKAEESSLEWLPVVRTGLDRLMLEEETGLIRAMAEFPILLQDICRSLEPHRLTYYLTDLAAKFHKYFNLGTKHSDCRVVGDDTLMSQQRLHLVDAIRITLANGLRLLGVESPERM